MSMPPSAPPGPSPRVVLLFLLSGLLPLLAGCQVGPGVASHRLIEHRAMLDLSGLMPVARFDEVKAQGAPPEHWERLALKKTALFTDLQWRSPSRLTGVGVAHVRMPLPLSAGALLWFARREYTRKQDDGRLIGQWSDALGRNWFEAENNRYHVRGYVLTRGFDAWFIYIGYKSAFVPDTAELMLASKCLETIVPDPGNDRSPPLAALPSQK